VLVPLGESSEWARNVLAAGHCRLHLHDTVYDLDEPALVRAGEVDALPSPVGRLMAALGFEYLVLRTFATDADTHAAPGEEPVASGQPDAAELVLAG